MKKLLKIFTVLLVLSVLVLTVSACKHDCKGEHAYEWHEPTATCTEAGNIGYYECTECHKLFNEDKVEITSDDLATEKLGHKWGEWTTTATCTDDGTKTRTCSRCSTPESQADAALGHTYTTADWIADTATCTVAGYVGHYHCDRCNKDFDRDNKVIVLKSETIPHTVDKTVEAKAPTCTENGNVAYTHCSVCNKNYGADGKEIANVVLAATDHNYGALIAEVAATCEAKGTKAHYHCDVCKKDFDADKKLLTDLTIAIKPHAFGELVAAKDPTCTEAGNVEYKYCSTCKKNYAKDGVTVIPDVARAATGHKYGDWVANEVVGEAKPTHTRVCANDAKHTETNDCVVATTLSYDNANHWYECSVCHGHRSQAPHKYVEGVCECGAHEFAVGVSYNGATKDLATLVEAFAYAAENYNANTPVNITLKSNLRGAGVMVVASKPVNVVLDLGTHTYTVIGPAVGSTGTESQGFHIEKGSKVTFKNGKIAAITDAESVNIKILVQNYCDLTLDKVVLDGTNLASGRYTLSNNFGSATIVNGSEIIAPANGVAFDVWFGMSTVYTDGVRVTVAEGCTINGKIEYGASANTDVANWTEKAILVLPAGTYNIAFSGKVTDCAQANITIGGTRMSHNYGELIAEVAATCTTKGTKAHYQCICGKLFVNDGTNYTEVTAESLELSTVATAHLYGDVIEKPATCTEKGLSAHYQCSECKKLFTKDGETYTEIAAATETDALGHDFVENDCSRCEVVLTQEEVLEKLFALKEPSGETGDKETLLTEGTYKLTGVISEILYAYSDAKGVTFNMVIGEGASAKTVQVYGLKDGEAGSGKASALCVGDTVTVVGTLALYKAYAAAEKVYEFTSGCTLKAVTKVQFAITWTAGTATITLDDDSTNLPATVDGGSFVSFKVTAADGMKIRSVKVNGVNVDAVENIYTVEVRANIEIKVESVRADMPTPYSLVKLDFASAEVKGTYTKQGGYGLSSELEIPFGGYTWTTVGANQYYQSKDGTSWDYIKLIGKQSSTNHVGTISVTIAKEITSIIVNTVAEADCTAKIKLEVIKDSVVVYTVEADIPYETKDIVLDVAAFASNCEYKLTVTGTRTKDSNGGVTINSINYYAIDCEHTWGEATIATAPTCVATGTQVQTCTKCENVKKTAIAVSNVHSFMSDANTVKADATPIVAAKNAGVNEMGTLAIYKCSDCEKYFVYDSAATVKFAEYATEEEAKTAAVIHKDTHTVNYTYDEGSNPFTHSGTCTECSYSITNEACDTSGTGGACSKCDKKDESISTVVLTINYIVDNAAPTATLPTGITLTWFEGENQTTVGDTLKHNTDYAFTYSSEDYKVDEVKINDEIKSATDGKYAVKVQTVAISIVIKVSTIHKEITVTKTIQALATSGSWTGSEQVNPATDKKSGSFAIDDVVTFGYTTTKTYNTGKYYSSDNTLRIYQNESPTFTISASAGYKIISVKITYNIKNTGIMTHNGSNVTSGTKLEVGATSITFGVGNTGTATNGQVQIKEFEIVYAAA